VRTTEYENFFSVSSVSAQGVISSIGTAVPRHSQTLYDWDGAVLVECTGLASILPDATLSSLQILNLTANTTYFVNRYTYDNLRRRTSRTDGRGRTESYQYDHAGRLTVTTDRNGISHTTVYGSSGNATGKVTTETSGTGSAAIVKNYTYNNAGLVSRVAETNAGVTTTISYLYDGSGNVIKETNGNIVKDFSEAPIDNGGRITREIITANSTQLTINGRQITSGGTQLKRTIRMYNASGQLVSVREGGTNGPNDTNGALKAEYTYTLFGELERTTSHNNTATASRLTETNTYNAAGMLLSTVNRRGTTNLSSYTYTYFLNGSQRAKTDGTGTTNYTYDGRGQLKEAVMPPPPSGGHSTRQEYTYDTNGNRTMLREINIIPGAPVQPVAREVAYTYDRSDRLLTERTGTQATVSYNYDANGNMTSKTGGTPSVIVIQTFDRLNRMTAYDRSGTTAYTQICSENGRDHHPYLGWGRNSP
jgi:YD repeat-containing protein